METKDPIELLRESLEYGHLDPLREKLGIELKPKWQLACLEKFADEIESQYMKLPVDKDGVPIRPGDLIENEYNHGRMTVANIGKHDVFVHDERERGFFVAPALCRHVKPDAVAEELAKFLTACGDDDPHHYDEQIAEFAERIRKVVEHG